MARPIQFTLHADALSPAELHAVLVDETYLRDRLAELGGSSAELVGLTSDDSGSRAVFRHGISSRGLPAAVRSIAPNGITVERTETWRREGEGYVGTMAARVADTPATIDATTSIRPVDGGAELRGAGQVTVRLPLVGGMVEKAVAEQVTALLDAESRFTLDRIARRRRG
ncbi:DUF2505 domain-containing protein [Actinoalloteichus spitiensis]|uniref:DUF2505 domain-containing protein n=1 Tax=Actinoalloteichus spitiensis TaxID=252394 RepID=UPI00037F7952|nr:DUF2505 domain-containing protein [Actinoalloteichus spitiensis]